MEGGYLGFAELQYVHMPLPGERLGLKGGGSRLTDEYHARQKALEAADRGAVVSEKETPLLDQAVEVIGKQRNGAKENAPHEVIP